MQTNTPSAEYSPAIHNHTTCNCTLTVIAGSVYIKHRGSVSGTLCRRGHPRAEYLPAVHNHTMCNYTVTVIAGSVAFSTLFRLSSVHVRQGGSADVFICRRRHARAEYPPAIHQLCFWTVLLHKILTLIAGSVAFSILLSLPQRSCQAMWTCKRSFVCRRKHPRAQDSPAMHNRIPFACHVNRQAL